MNNLDPHILLQSSIVRFVKWKSQIPSTRDTNKLHFEKKNLIITNKPKCSMSISFHFLKEVKNELQEQSVHSFFFEGNLFTVVVMAKAS